MLNTYNYNTTNYNIFGNDKDAMESFLSLQKALCEEAIKQSDKTVINSNIFPIEKPEKTEE